MDRPRILSSGATPAGPSKPSQFIEWLEEISEGYSESRTQGSDAINGTGGLASLELPDIGPMEARTCREPLLREASLKTAQLSKTLANGAVKSFGILVH